MKTRIRSLAFGFVVFHTGFASVPGNLIPNGDFATSTAGWTCTGTCDWSSDSASNDGTGSISFPTGTSGTISSSCFRVSANTTYDMGFQAIDDVGPTGDTFALTCTFYGDANCSTYGGEGPELTEVYYSGSGGSPLWESSSPWSFRTSAEAQAANCSVSWGGYGGSQGFDDIFFAQPDPIFADGFDTPMTIE